MRNYKNFIVTCHGWSASNWIAHSLNLNKVITCAHSARVAHANDKDLQSHKNLRQVIDKLQNGYKQRTHRSLDELNQSIFDMENNEHIGSVHVLRMRDIPQIIDSFGTPSTNFDLVNVVRNPIDLVWSGYGQFTDLFLFDINELAWTSTKVVNQALDFANYIARKYNLNIGQIENLSFFGACAVLESLKKDFTSIDLVKDQNNINLKGIFKMEDLTTSRDSFHNLLETLNIESKYITNEYLDSVFSSGKINEHKNDKKKISGIDRYNSFSDWQKEVFNHFVELHDIKSTYSDYGYKFPKQL